MGQDPGTRERGGSVWLGRADTASDVFERYRDIDRWLLSSLSQASGGLAPGTLAAAALDWWAHLLASPAKQLALAQLGGEAALQFAGWSWGGGCGCHPPCPFEPLPQDKRFAAAAWHELQLMW